MPPKAAAGPVTEHLRAAILASQKSQKMIAEECGLAQPIINRFVRRERDLSGKSIDRLASYFSLRLAPDTPPAVSRKS